MQLLETQSMELAPEILQRVMSWIELPDGSRRAFYQWQSGSQPAVATVLIVPGLGEHGGRYAESASHFTAANINVCAIDLQGHGHSPGKRGCIKSYENLLDDIEAAISHVRQASPACPLVLWGHSMGGNLVINTLLRRSSLPDYAIASGPMLRAVRLPSPLFIWCARQISQVFPNWQLGSSVEPQHCTSDPRQLKLMRADRLYFRSLSLRLGAALIDSGEWALHHASQLTTPLLLVHGTQDLVTSVGASQQFAISAGKLCELVLLKNRLHDVHRDQGSDEVFSRLIGWIKQSVA